MRDPKANSYKLPEIAEIIRAGIWESKVSPPMFGTMEIFGKATCILRFEDFKKLLKKLPEVYFLDNFHKFFFIDIMLI